MMPEGSSMMLEGRGCALHEQLRASPFSLYSVCVRCVVCALSLITTRCLDKAAIRTAEQEEAEAITQQDQPQQQQLQQWQRQQDQVLPAAVQRRRHGGRGGSGKPRPPVSVSEVEETKAFLSIMPLFLCICV